MEIPDLKELVIEFLLENHIKAVRPFRATPIPQIWVYHSTASRDTLTCTFYVYSTGIAITIPYTGKGAERDILRAEAADPTFFQQILDTLDKMEISHYPPDKE